MSATKLAPTPVTLANVGDVAFDGVRRRPVVAVDAEGQLVVCCRRTAAKHGWKVEGTLHGRSAVTTKEPTPASGKGATSGSQARRKATR